MTPISISRPHKNWEYERSRWNRTKNLNNNKWFISQYIYQDLNDFLSSNDSDKNNKKKWDD